MNFFSSWILRRQLIRQNKKWRNSLKKRTNNEYAQHWSHSNVDVDCDCIEDIAKIMKLPNVYLHPDDKLSDILFNPFLDFSDVESILLIERKRGIKINKKYIYLMDIFSKNLK